MLKKKGKNDVTSRKRRATNRFSRELGLFIQALIEDQNLQHRVPLLGKGLSLLLSELRRRVASLPSSTYPTVLAEVYLPLYRALTKAHQRLSETQ